MLSNLQIAKNEYAKKTATFTPTKPLKSLWKPGKLTQHLWTEVNDHWAVIYPAWHKAPHRLPGNIGKVVMIGQKLNKDNKLSYQLHHLLKKKHPVYKELDNLDKLNYLNFNQLTTLELNCITELLSKLDPYANTLPTKVRHL